MTLLGIAEATPVAAPEPGPSLPVNPDAIDRAWQLEVRGLIIGPGTAYRLKGFSKLRARDVRRGNDLTMAGQHGARAYGQDMLDPLVRVLTLSWGYGNGGITAAEVWQALNTLERAWKADDEDVALTFMAPDGTELVMYGRTRGYQFDPEYAAAGYGEADLEFVAMDPRWYGTEHTVALSPASAEGGLTWPLTWPLEWGVVEPGRGTLYNGGTIGAPWQAVLEANAGANIDDPRVINLSTGQVLELSGVQVPVGQKLTYDSSDGSIMLNGVADRDGKLTVDSEWWDLEPGEDTNLLLTTEAGGGLLTFTWRDAYG